MANYEHGSVAALPNFPLGGHRGPLGGAAVVHRHGPGACALDAFEAFCAARMCAENVLFLRAARAYRGLAPGLAPRRAAKRSTSAGDSASL